MMNFKIYINAEISKIKFLLSSSIQNLDFHSKNKNRTFESTIDGMNFRLWDIHRYSYFQSPSLKGKIKQEDNNKYSIDLSFSFNIIYILYILVLLLIPTFSLLGVINPRIDTKYVFGMFIFILFFFMELYKIKIKISRLKSFLYRIYSEYIIEN